jgi:hypothetical protein
LRLKSEDVDNLGASSGGDVAKRLLANPNLLEHAGPVFFEDLPCNQTRHSTQRVALFFQVKSRDREGRYPER